MKDFGLMDAATLARAKKKVQFPWLPLEWMPKDGREFIGLWLDIDGTWNVDFMQWSDSNHSCMSRSGILYGNVLGWMPRPAMPGKARLS